MIHFLLLALDPDMAASRWAELLDTDQVPADRLALAASALARSGHPPDIARLDALLVQGDDPERLAVASVVLLRASTGGLAPGLVSRASDTLAEVYRVSPDPLVRRKILYAARIGPPELVPLALQALRADEAMIVREAAVLCLQPALASDPRVREALTRAAAEDPEERVRQAAAQALR